jgi:uroporphyrinogen-III synthase
MSSPHKILSTKKLDPSLKEEMEQKAVEVVEQEFITIQPINTLEKHQEVFLWITNTEPIAVAFTSQHAVTYVFKHLHSYDTYYVPAQWKLFCLEGATRNAVIEQKYDNQVVDTASNATELAKKIITNGTFKKALFFCGNKRRDELPALLKEQGIEVHEVIVYETVETPVVATQDMDAVLFFSPSAVKSFFSVNSLPKKTACFAIGATTAQAITDYTDNRVITSDDTTQESLLASVWFYLQNINIYE